MWECTGGSAVLGEDTYMAAIREAKEELVMLHISLLVLLKDIIQTHL